MPYHVILEIHVGAFWETCAVLRFMYYFLSWKPDHLKRILVYISGYWKHSLQ